MIVVDTNVVSELMREAPAPVVRDWVRTHAGGDLYTTAITLAEIRYGIARLPRGRRKELFISTADELFVRFADQILAFDAVAAGFYASIVAHRDVTGRPIDGFDAQIASICRAHGAALATRNLKDFRNTEIDLIDPWNDPLPA